MTKVQTLKDARIAEALERFRNLARTPFPAEIYAMILTRPGEARPTLQSDAALIAKAHTTQTERFAELGHFIDALGEWGCEDPHEQAGEIEKFLRSECGLEEYRETPSPSTDARASRLPQQEGVREALDAYDKYIAPCPINSPRRLARNVKCPACGADASQNCGLEVTASGRLVEAVRQALALPPEARTPKAPGGLRLEFETPPAALAGAREAIQALIDQPLVGRTGEAWERGRRNGLKEALAALSNEVTS